MNLMKLFGVSALVLGLAACGAPEEESTTKTEGAAKAVQEETAPAAKEVAEVAEQAKEAATEAVEEVKEVVKEAVKEPEPIKLEPPEGMIEGSVEHTMWLLEQQDAH